MTNEILVVGSHQLTAALRHMGHEVVHGSTPLAPLALFRLGDPRVRQRIAAAREFLDRDSMEAMPVSLSRSPIVVGGASIASWATLMPVSLKRDFDLLVIDQPRVAGLERRIPHKALVYRATDVYSSMPGGRRVEAAERHLVRSADVVVATSEPVRGHLSQYGREVELIENGVPESAFVALPAEAERSGLIWVGAIDERFDVGLVRALAASIPNAQVRLIGPWSIPVPRLPDNVEVVGPMPYDKALGAMRHASVGILPFSRHPANEGRSPMKVYEYLAAGLPVVAVSTPELARRSLEGVVLTDGDRGFVEAAELQLATGQERERHRVAAADHRWPKKAAELLRVAGLG